MSFTFTAVTDLLRRALGTGMTSDESRAAALEMLSAITSGHRLAELLDSVRTSPRHAAACAANSHQHPLGFDRLVLVDAEPVFMLRIHVWWPGQGRGPEHVHNHRFAFASSIIYGSYEMEVLIPGPVGETMNEYQERIAPITADWQLDHRGSIHLRTMTTTKLQRGSSYSIAANTLHRVRVPAGTTCISLFLETAVTGSATQVFTPPGQAPATVTRKKALTERGFRQRLDAVIAQLAGPADLM